MVIQHNLSAMNTNRMFKLNNKKKAALTEKLSSGYRINRSADDAAGLAISEKNAPPDPWTDTGIRKCTGRYLHGTDCRWRYG